MKYATAVFLCMLVFLTCCGRMGCQREKAPKKELKERAYESIEKTLKKITDSPYGVWILRIIGIFAVVAVCIICWKILLFLWSTDGATILKGMGLIALTIVVIGATLLLGDSNIPSLIVSLIELAAAIAAGVKFVYKPAKEKIKKKQR